MVRNWSFIFRSLSKLSAASFQSFYQVTYFLHTLIVQKKSLLMEERDNFANNVYADAFSDCELEWFESNNNNDAGSDAIQTEEYQNNKRSDESLITETNLLRGQDIFYIHTRINSRSLLRYSATQFWKFYAKWCSAKRRCTQVESGDRVFDQNYFSVISKFKIMVWWVIQFVSTSALTLRHVENIKWRLKDGGNLFLKFAQDWISINFHSKHFFVRSEK